MSWRTFGHHTARPVMLAPTRLPSLLADPTPLHKAHLLRATKIVVGEADVVPCSTVRPGRARECPCRGTAASSKLLSIFRCIGLVWVKRSGRSSCSHVPQLVAFSRENRSPRRAAPSRRCHAAQKKNRVPPRILSKPARR